MATARPGSFTGSTDNPSSGGLFGDTQIAGISDTVATDVAAANTSATNAKTSETNAAASATTASTKATEASTSAANAATSETNAASSATSASTSASTATTQASTATTKATEAATSATNAATSETNAAASATAASTSASNASTSEGNASSSASSASASASSAATSATNAANSYDAFDDRYLGSKSSDPTADNDGDALTDGALYFDTTNNVLKVYDLGNTSWVRTTPTTTQQTAINTVSARDADIATVAARDADIGTVADRDADIGTVASRDANIGTVAARDSDIGTVAGNDANITTVAGISTNVTTVAGISGNVTTVANNNTNVNTVAGISGNVTTVAGISADVTAVANISQDIQDVQDEIANIQTLASDLNEVTSEIDTVAASITNVDTVGGAITNVNAVAGNATNINAVAGNATNINSVAGNSTNINSVASNSTNINTVATNITDVNTFADTYFISATAPSSPTIGDLWFDTTNNIMKVYASGGFVNAGSSVNGTSERKTYAVGTSEGSYTGSTTVFPATYDAGFIDVYLNGIKLDPDNDFTASNGTSITLSTAATTGSIVDIVAYGTFELANFSIGTANDVDLTGLADNQFLQYNSSTSNFEPATIATDVSGDSTPQLGGNLDVNGNSIVSASNGNISITPNGTGSVIIDGLSHPQADGSANQFLKTNGSGQLSFETIFPSGTKMLFNQTSAPTGWTKDTTNNNNSALRVVTGTVGTGGSADFTSALATPSVTGTVTTSIANTTAGGTVGNHTLTVAQLASHNHSVYYHAGFQGGTAAGAGGGDNATTVYGGITSSTGSNSAHNHSFTGSAHNHTATSTLSSATAGINVKYVDVIIASKD